MLNCRTRTLSGCYSKLNSNILHEGRLDSSFCICSICICIYICVVFVVLVLFVLPIHSLVCKLLVIFFVLYFSYCFFPVFVGLLMLFLFIPASLILWSSNAVLISFLVRFFWICPWTLHQVFCCLGTSR